MTISVRDFAHELGTDPQTARRFLRSIHPDNQPSKGHRWEIDREDLKDLKTKFEDFHRPRHRAGDPVKVIRKMQKDLKDLEMKLDRQ